MDIGSTDSGSKVQFEIQDGARAGNAVIGKCTIGYYNKCKAIFDIFINFIIGVINIFAVNELIGKHTNNMDFSMLELFFLVELILNFQQGFKNEEGIEIYDRSQIRKFYLKSTFCLDFLPILIDFLEFVGE